MSPRPVLTVVVSPRVDPIVIRYDAGADGRCYQVERGDRVRSYLDRDETASLVGDLIMDALVEAGRIPRPEDEELGI